MHPLQKIKKAFIKKVMDLSVINVENAGWHKIGGSSTYYEYKTNAYENAYPSINRIANACVMTEPYAIDKNGKSVASNIIDRIYTPNTAMSAQDFREALAIMTLVHPEVHLRVHYRGNRITADSITGFTFIEGNVRRWVGGKYTYRLVDGTVLDDSEVLTLKSINPYDLTEGFSPTQSAQKWTTLDDYIAQYQQGFFRNGAIPAGQFIITAPSVTEYNDIVDRLQERHRGAGKNNNVTYTHRPVDASGKAQQAQIEWIPFNVQNKELSLKDLFEQANKKIDSAYGVPASIRAVNDNNTYASVRVDEVIFNKYVVDPFLLKLWGKFTHELNRITGGAGIAIGYDLEIPQIADEEKVKAESKQIELNMVMTAVDKGYSAEVVVDALGLHEGLKKLTKATVEPPKIEEPQIASPDELKDTPEPEMPLAKKLKVKQLSREIRSEYERRVRDVAKRQMELQALNALEDVKSKAITPTEEEIAKFVSELEVVLIPLIYQEGAIQRSIGYNLILEAGLDTSGLAQFSLTPEQLADYKNYLKLVGASYTDTNAEAIRQILARSAEQQLTAQQTRRAVLDFVGEEWRAQRIAVTEVNRAGSKASVNAMENIERETGFKIYKVWNTNPGACEYCQAKDGTRVQVSSTFVPVGGDVIGVDGGVFKNDFTSVDDCTLHPNCSCYPTYEVDR